MARKRSKAEGLAQLALSRAKLAKELVSKGSCKGATTAARSSVRAIKASVKSGKAASTDKAKSAAAGAVASVERACAI